MRWLVYAMTAALSMGCAASNDAAQTPADAGLGGADGSGGTGGEGNTGGGGVIPDNQKPELVRIGDREAPVGEQLEIELEAEDPDGDPLSFALRSRLPNGAKFEKETGLFTWTPIPAQEGTATMLTFEVTDGQLKDQETIQITVVANGTANSAPTLENPGDQVLVAGAPFDLDLVATDPNGDPLSFSLTGDDLPGATLDTRSGHFSWTPPAAATGESFSVTFSVTDGSLVTAIDVKLVVQAPGEVLNLPPRIQAIDDRDVSVGEDVRVVVLAEDEAPDALVYGVAGDLPDHASFNAGTHTFTWTPGPEQAGLAFPIVFQVSDGEFRAVERVTLNVERQAASCLDDAGEGFEPVALVNETVLDERSICPMGDVDTYSFDLSIHEGFRVVVNFLHSEGDIDLLIKKPNGEVVFDSGNLGDSERAGGVAPVGGTYTAEVVCTGCTNPNYDIEFVRVEVAACQDDELNNHSPQTAEELDVGLDRPLHICAEVDDYFVFNMEAGTLALIEAFFPHADGDIDIELTGPDDFRLTSTSSTDDESIMVEAAPVTGMYQLRVYGFSGAENSYVLRYEAEAPAFCEADRLESNDTLQQAEALAPDLYRGLTACAEPDFYSTNVPAGQDLRVFFSYDGAAPSAEAFDVGGVRLEGQSFLVPDQAECQPGRDGCVELRVPGRDQVVYYRLTAGDIGQAYDLDIELHDAAGCAMSCDELSVCDYGTGECVDAFCNSAGVDTCTDDYLCYQDWCVDLCDNHDDCAHPYRTCKVLDGLPLCGYEGAGATGDTCFDFSDCLGSLGCFDSWPGGACSRACDGDGDCEGEICVSMPGEGQVCAAACLNDDGCREGYICVDAGGSSMACLPE